VLLISNHVSFFDVFCLGIMSPRPLNYVARSTLFSPLLGPVIRSVGGFPIQREGMGAQGVKETLRRLRAGGIVTLFPEGTRSPDGEIGPLKPGLAALVSRAKVPIVPAGIAGAFESWPRTARFPRPSKIHVHYGPSISPERIAGMDHAAILELVDRSMRECLETARREIERNRSSGSGRSATLGKTR
jgi:1-acyl-sn-glycerol-3-phosphate acyltransferase